MIVLHKGQLYVRIHDGDIASFFYTDEDVLEGYRMFQSKKVARILSDVGGAEWGTYTDGASHGSHSESGILIEFREAVDEDIQKLLRKWGEEGPSIREWIIKLQKSGLLNSEKTRIAQIAQSFS